jgi:serine phosphatase RsbU (regulator of sigma subunit)/anti-sigma regulatory factor (Ser/Thr protein kinase)
MVTKLRLPARLETLADFLAFVAERSAASGFSATRTGEVQLTVEEAVVNIVRHAYPHEPGDIELRWRAGDAGRVTIEIEDTGVPFDIRSVPAPDLQADLADRRVGGLGVFFIMNLVDEVDYKRDGDKNVLTLVLGPSKPASGPPASSDPSAADDWRFPLGSMNRETFKKGDVLFKAGDPADKMYYVARGSLKLLEIDKVVREGEVIGEMGILSPFHARTATAVSQEDLEAYTIDKDDVIRLFARNSALAFQVVNLCIRRFIENLRAETEAKERIQSELRIARDIQISMLPRVFPPFPERREFDIFALMEPAKEVGGDFYDFFLIDRRRLGVVIGDVSGKGVPAALFMAICKTLLKTEALRGLPPAEILARVNQMLIPDNETMMFVTVFLLVLDLETGEIRFANGGHPPPLVSSGPGRFEFLEVPAGTVLGALEDRVYTTVTRTLRPGEAIFLYTDGMTEAMDSGQGMFSEDRLKAGLCAAGTNDPVEVIRRLRADVRAFVGETPPWDDITMVALTFWGAAGRGPADKRTP